MNKGYLKYYLQINYNQISFNYFVSLFDFSMFANATYNDGDSWCFIDDDGLTAKQKILWDLLIPVIIIIFIVISIIYKFNCE